MRFLSSALLFSPFLIVSAVHADDVETIEVRAERNRLLASELADNNTKALAVFDTATVKSTWAEWLAVDPSAHLNGQGGLLQSYSVRGFSRARIRTEVDGVPIITDRRAGNSASFISPVLIERIDLQKGPSSTLYGSDAMGGVINLVSTQFETNQVSTSWQSNDQYKELGLLLGNETIQTGLSYRHANDAEAANNTALNNGFEQFGGLVKWSSIMNGINVKASWLPSLAKNIGKSSSQYPSERIVDYPEELHSVSQVALQKDNDWYLKLFHHYQNWDTDTLRVGSRQNTTNYQSHTLGGLALVSTQWLAGEGRIGVDWLSRKGVDIRDTEMSLTGEVNYHKKVVDAAQDNYALFSDLHWQIDTIKVSVGARFDVIEQRQHISEAVTESKVDEQQLNGSFAIEHNFSADHQLRFEWGTGFRFPTLSELYFEGETPRGTTIGNANLVPEQSQGSQLRWLAQLAPNWQMNAEAYYYNLDNYIERYDINDGVRSYRNLDSARIYGAELSLAWQGTSTKFKPWSMVLSGQYQKGETDDGQILADLLPAKITWHTDWRGEDWQGDSFTWTNQLTWQLSQKNIGSGEVRRDNNFVWNMSLEKPLSSDVTLSVYGKNLTDSDHFTTADEDAPYTVGRSFGAKLTISFN